MKKFSIFFSSLFFLLFAGWFFNVEAHEDFFDLQTYISLFPSDQPPLYWEIGVTVDVRDQNGNRTFPSSLTRVRLDENNDGTWDIITYSQNAGGGLPIEWPYLAETPRRRWSTRPGTHKIEACTDFENQYIETDETNNCAAIILNYPDGFNFEGADGSFYRTTPNPYNPIAGSQVTFFREIINEGPRTPAPPTTARLRIDLNNDGTWDIIPPDVEVPSLPAGQLNKHIVTWPEVWQAVPGNHRAQICIDPDNLIEETNEEDNCSATEFTVTTEPSTDLRTIIHLFPSDQPPLYWEIGVTVDVRDQNGNRTFPSSLTRVRLDENNDGTWDIITYSQNAGGGLPIEWPYLAETPRRRWSTRPGTHKIEACTDFENQYIETNETNNCDVVILNYPDGFNFKGAETSGYITLTPRNPLVDSEVIISQAVMNEGPRSSPPTTARLRIDLNNDGTWDIIPPDVGIPALGRGNLNRYSVSWPWQATPGTHRVQICTDPDNLLEETDEEDNCGLTDPFTVSEAPDFAAVDEDVAAEEVAEELLEEPGEEVFEEEVEETRERAKEKEEKIKRAVDPKILPGNPLYFFKNGFREIRSFFTFDPEKKAGLRLRYSNEKILEANKLTDQGKIGQAVKHLNSYEKDLQKMEALSEKLDEKFNQELLRNQLKQQVLVGKFERKATAKELGEIKEVRTKTFEHIGKTVAKIAEVEKVEEIFEKSLTKDGSPFKSLRNLEVLKAVEEKVPEEAKGAIRQAQENSLERFKSQIETMSEEYRKLLVGYVEKAGGDETVYLKIFDNLKFKAIEEKAQGQIIAAKEKLLSCLENRIQEVQQEDTALTKKLFSGISEGTIENLKVIKNIEANIDPNLISPITEVKKEVFEKLSDKIETFDTPEKKEKFVKETLSLSPDVSQIEILNEVKEALPEDKKSIAEDLKMQSINLLKERFVEAQQEKDEAKRQAKLQVLVGDDPKQLETLKEIKEIIGKTVAESLISIQAKNLEKRTEKIETETKTKEIEKSEIKEEVKETPKPLVPILEIVKPEKLILETKNDLTKIIEGDIIYFEAVLVMSDGQKKNVTSETDWQILGLIGAITKPGIFAAKLDSSVSELGESSGTVVAVWKNPKTGEFFLAKSPILKVKAKVEETEET